MGARQIVSHTKVWTTGWAFVNTEWAVRDATTPFDGLEDQRFDFRTGQGVSDPAAARTLFRGTALGGESVQVEADIHELKSWERVGATKPVRMYFPAALNKKMPVFEQASGRINWNYRGTETAQVVGRTSFYGLRFDNAEDAQFHFQAPEHDNVNGFDYRAEGIAFIDCRSQNGYSLRSLGGAGPKTNMRSYNHANLVFEGGGYGGVDYRGEHCFYVTNMRGPHRWRNVDIWFCPRTAIQVLARSNESDGQSGFGTVIHEDTRGQDCTFAIDSTLYSLKGNNHTSDVVYRGVWSSIGNDELVIRPDGLPIKFKNAFTCDMAKVIEFPDRTGVPHLVVDESIFYGGAQKEVSADHFQVNAGCQVFTFRRTVVMAWGVVSGMSAAFALWDGGGNSDPEHFDYNPNYGNPVVLLARFDVRSIVIGKVSFSPVPGTVYTYGDTNNDGDGYRAMLIDPLVIDLLNEDGSDRVEIFDSDDEAGEDGVTQKFWNAGPITMEDVNYKKKVERGRTYFRTWNAGNVTMTANYKARGRCKLIRRTWDAGTIRTFGYRWNYSHFDGGEQLIFKKWNGGNVRVRFERYDNSPPPGTGIEKNLWKSEDIQLQFVSWTRRITENQPRHVHKFWDAGEVRLFGVGYLKRVIPDLGGGPVEIHRTWDAGDLPIQFVRYLKLFTDVDGGFELYHEVWESAPITMTAQYLHTKVDGGPVTIRKFWNAGNVTMTRQYQHIHIDRGPVTIHKHWDAFNVTFDQINWNRKVDSGTDIKRSWNAGPLSVSAGYTKTNVERKARWDAGGLIIQPAYSNQDATTKHWFTTVGIADVRWLSSTEKRWDAGAIGIVVGYFKGFASPFREIENPIMLNGYRATLGRKVLAFDWQYATDQEYELRLYEQGLDDYANLSRVLGGQVAISDGVTGNLVHQATLEMVDRSVGKVKFSVPSNAIRLDFPEGREVITLTLSVRFFVLNPATQAQEFWEMADDAGNRHFDFRAQWSPS